MSVSLVCVHAGRRSRLRCVRIDSGFTGSGRTSVMVNSMRTVIRAGTTRPRAFRTTCLLSSSLVRLTTSRLLFHFTDVV